MNVTIKDIAARLNLSHGTVSRALADNPRISATTKEAVRLAAREMGYVPNGSAKNMRNAHSPIIGLIVPDIENDFYAAVAKIVADAAAELGFQLLLSITEDNPERELKELTALVVSRVAGVIFTPSESPLPETIALLNGVHAVQLVRQNSAISADAVVMDEFAAIRAATEHLVHYGHKQIAYVGATSGLSNGQDRLNGFTSAMQAAQLPAHLTAVGSPRIDFAHHVVHRLMNSSLRPTALIIGSSRLTVGALKALKNLGLQSPEDVSLVGYGDPDWFELIGNGLTTLSPPVQSIGSYAINLLLSHINGESGLGDASRFDVMRFAADLKVRGSTKPLQLR